MDATTEDGKCKADPYFALEKGKFGRFKIKTTSVETIMNNIVEKRTLVVADKLARLPTRKVQHFQFLHWKYYGVPEGHKDIRELMEMVEKYKKPIVVHCSSGVGRTITFNGIHTATQMVINRPEIRVEEILNTMRDQSWKWLILRIIYKLIKMYKMDTDVYETQLKFFKKNSARSKMAARRLGKIIIKKIVKQLERNVRRKTLSKTSRFAMKKPLFW